MKPVLLIRSQTWRNISNSQSRAVPSDKFKKLIWPEHYRGLNPGNIQYALFELSVDDIQGCNTFIYYPE